MIENIFENFWSNIYISLQEFSQENICELFPLKKNLYFTLYFHKSTAYSIILIHFDNLEI